MPPRRLQRSTPTCASSSLIVSARFRRTQQARRRQRASDQLSALRVGDVVVLATGRRGGPALVVTPANPNDDEPRPSVLTLDRRVRRIAANDVTHGVEAIARMKVPRGFDPRSANWRRDLARTLADRTADLDIRRPRKSVRPVPQTKRLNRCGANSGPTYAMAAPTVRHTLGGRSASTSSAGRLRN